jgi:outer membrane lipoprotein SlyB
MALGLVSVMLMTLLLGGVLIRVQDRARAQTAADAAALAGAVDGRAAAALLASANAAELVDFESDGSMVVVEVRTDRGTRARARAERRLGLDPGG